MSIKLNSHFMLIRENSIEDSTFLLYRERPGSTISQRIKKPPRGAVAEGFQGLLS